MRFTIATIAAMAVSASATVLPRSDLGGWNVSYVQTGGSDRTHSEHVHAVYANAELADNIAVDCLSQTTSDGQVFSGNDPTTLTCTPASFSYVYNTDGMCGILLPQFSVRVVCVRSFFFFMFSVC
jgi:hypothetical protein